VAWPRGEVIRRRRNSLGVAAVSFHCCCGSYHEAAIAPNASAARNDSITDIHALRNSHTNTCTCRSTNLVHWSNPNGIPPYFRSHALVPASLWMPLLCGGVYSSL